MPREPGLVTSFPSTSSIVLFCPAQKGDDNFLGDNPLKRLRLTGDPVFKRASTFRLAGDWHALTVFSPRTRLPSLTGVDWDFIECILRVRSITGWDNCCCELGEGE